MVLDTESILIPGLDLQLSNPGYFFWTGNTTYPDGLTGQGSFSNEVLDEIKRMNHGTSWCQRGRITQPH